VTGPKAFVKSLNIPESQSMTRLKNVAAERVAKYYKGNVLSKCL